MNLCPLDRGAVEIHCVTIKQKSFPQGQVAFEALTVVLYALCSTPEHSVQCVVKDIFGLR